MGLGHPDHLYVHRSSPLHDLPPQCKVAGAVLFVLAVVATPREAVWAYGADAVAVAALARVAGVTAAVLVRRLVIGVPFVAFAFLLPFVAGGERVELGPLALSEDGLWAAWNILVKGTLGVTVAVVLTATTEPADIVRGLERLHLPRGLTMIMSLMIRYLVVIRGEAGRMHIARQARGYDPRWFWQAKALAHGAGTLFVRSYERGERVHLAMVSRGFAGRLPAPPATADPTAGQWAAGLGPALVAAVIAAVAWGVAP